MRQCEASSSVGVYQMGKLATCNLQMATCNPQPATCNLPLAICNQCPWHCVAAISDTWPRSGWMRNGDGLHAIFLHLRGLFKFAAPWCGFICDRGSMLIAPENWVIFSYFDCCRWPFLFVGPGRQSTAHTHENVS